MKKRTKQLDDAREVALPTLGKDVFTTAGSLTLSPDEQAEKAAKQRAGRRHGVVQGFMHDIMGEVNLWARQVVVAIAPASAAHKGLLGDWVTENGIRVTRFGLTWIMLNGQGTEIARLSLNQVPAAFRSDVIAAFDEHERGVRG